MTRSADSASRLIIGLGGVGLATLALITLASPGATRMHASPWSMAYALALVVPAAILALRQLNRERPLAVPSASWLFTALAGAVIVLVSGLFSPFRGPVLLWSTPLLAGLAVFFVVFDWLHASPTVSAQRRDILLKFLGVALAVVAVASMGQWIRSLSGLTVAQVIDARNPYPLGHSNYTAGLAVLMLPCFTELARRSSGKTRAAWVGAGLLALGLLLTSGSRGGLVGLVALLLGALLASRLGWKKSLALAVTALAATVLLALAHPRTRAMFQPANPLAAPNVSNLQRRAMLEAGLELGCQRPLLGWGAGSTPLAFPRVRGSLDAGGVEDVLQLHCLPVQAWAELGGLGLAWLVVGGLLILRHASRDPLAAVTLGGYLVFAFTDCQLDIPVFTFVLALLAARLATPAATATPAGPRWVGLGLRLSVVVLLGFSRPDPTPELNLQALAQAQSAHGADEAVELFNESLALNPSQEIAHFNLAWLQVVRQPAVAEQHFLAAARLVPDKGGVYFGLALARLNQRHRQPAIRALALECLNDPIFLTSPWWRNPNVEALRPDTMILVRQLLAEVKGFRVAERTSTFKDLVYLDALALWLDSSAPPGALLSAANTSERAAYFAGRPTLPPFNSAAVRFYRRERSGYPVLMRNLDLATPIDLFDVQENSLAAGELRFLFPRKGWLPAPLMLYLLEHPSPSAE